MRSHARRLGALGLALGAAALSPVVLGPREGLASSTILGIPGECRMDTYRVQVGPEGAPPAAPVKLATMEMRGSVAPRGFHMSHDGKTIVAQQFKGVSVIRADGKKDYKVTIVYRNVFWSPDSKRILFWVPEGVAIADMDNLGDPDGNMKYTVAYKRKEGRMPFGAGWAPEGNGFYVMEHYKEKAGDKTVEGTMLSRVSVDGSAREVHKHPTLAGYFMLPLSRAEGGSGPSSDPYRIVFGGKDGLFVIDRDGSDKARISDFTPDGLQDIVMGPDGKKEKFLFRLAKPQTLPDGKTTLKGVCIGHLDRLKKGEKVEMESVYGGNDAHTIWFSPKGTYVTWASETQAGFREPDGKPGSETLITIAERPIRGISWNRAETQVAVAAANKIYVYDVAKKTTTVAADMGTEPKTFVADPVWREGELVFTQFTDLGAQKRKPTPVPAVDPKAPKAPEPKKPETPEKPEPPK